MDYLLLQIIILLETTNLTQDEIARKFNINRCNVTDINNCKTYSKLHNYKNNIRKETSND